MMSLFDDLLPPLSTEEFDALRADIKEHGVLSPVFVDEEGNVLDGRHRLRIDPKAPRKVIRGLTEPEKKAFVYRCNYHRRNLSPEQKEEIDKARRVVSNELRESDPKKWTQKRVAATMGCSRQTVSAWWDIPDAKNGNRNRPHSQIKLNQPAKDDIVRRVKAGERQAQVAADYGVKQGTVSKVVKAEAKQEAAKQERAAAAAKITGDCGVIHGDFREQGAAVADASVDLIFTDPPYDEEAAEILYGDLATFAARVLRPGGWLLSYSGHAHLPLVMAEMQVEGLEYGWTFCCLHSGGDLRFRKYKLQNGWKPIIGFYRPPLAVAWDWFKDVVSGGKEKDGHEWQQAESEAAHFIERLSAKGGFVCDPFCGSGTTLAAAKAIGRRWIGFDVDSTHVETARLRVA